MRRVCNCLWSMSKRRLDTLLAERGLFASRTRAAASVMAGEVRLGTGQRRAEKPGEMVDEEELVTLASARAIVSRGGIKLANALNASGLEVSGRRALDVGASTGGFTDCLLQRGAREVIAVDVGYGTLDYSLRVDPRVLVMERTNARALTPDAARAGRIHDAPTLRIWPRSMSSFISLSKVLGAVLGCLGAGYDVLALVKPQFELGRGRVGKGGVVRDSAERREALLGVGRGRARAGCRGARLPLLGAAGTEGQPRDLHLAGRPGPGARGRRQR